METERANKRRRLSRPHENVQSLPGFAQVDLENEYANRLRTKQKKENKRLLVREQEKNRWTVEHRDGSASDASSEDEVDVDDDSENGEKDSGVADLQFKQAPRKPKLPPKEEIRQAKEELARIAGLISENPEEHVGSLATLAQLAGYRTTTVKKLALGTQLAVYKDAIPGYRIRPLSNDDLQAKVSKDVRKLRNFEQSLLGGYKDYVAKLGALSQNENGSVDPSVVTVAISCACNLLTTVPHFNCRNDLIALLVRKLSSRSVDLDFVRCREAVEQLFQDDEEGHTSLETVKQLTNMMKDRSYRTDESVLNTFLHLRLLSEFSHKASTDKVDKDDEEGGKPNKKQKQKREFRSKRERKLLKERKEVEKEMKEADASVSYEERDKNQAETLKLVFVAYFRILKARTQHLMGAVLEGLAKYAHLINQDFFGDVLEALKDLIHDAQSSLEDDDTPDSDTLPLNRNITREALLCIITAFALLQGQTEVVKSANTLHLDLNFFITHLYGSLLALSMDQDVELSSKRVHLADPNGLPIPTSATKDAKVNVATTTVLLLRSLQAVLLPSIATRMVPPLRVAAFVKQLHTAVLHLPQKSAVAVMGLLNEVTKVHGKKISALWFTEERKGDGVFDALSEGVEGSNPFAGTVWEEELLRLHFDPRVRDGLKGMQDNVVRTR